MYEKKNIKFHSELINFNKVSEISSKLATYPNVRRILLKKQKLLRCLPGLIAEGRDMGTVVFPDAIVKFFLNAHLEIRVKRRMSELKKNGFFISFQELFIEMRNRDIQDENRLISPLSVPKNAIILDSSYMNLSEVVTAFMKSIIPKIKIQ
ncbi:(d)CMP kinase [Buchnera aphidicola]|uniref:(d)CMP kinase n=1 Tax=Buchnera aphidicola TaxID=9 RepID=UPI002E15197A